MKQACGIHVVVLSGEQVREYSKMGKIIVEPFDEGLVGPSQIDLRLGSNIRVFKESGPVDPFYTMGRAVDEGFDSFVVNTLEKLGPLRACFKDNLG